MKLSKWKDVYRVLKAKPSLKNVDLNKTGIPPGTPIFLKPKFVQKFYLNKVVESFWVSKDLCRISYLTNKSRL